MKNAFFFLLFSLQTFYLIATAQPVIFREYDIRGIVGEEFLVDDAEDIAAAIASYLLAKDVSVKKIAIGADGRVHSPAIKEAIMRAILSYGLDIVDIGTCTTPVMYFATHTLPVDAGLMITASHNPGNYNGIKICHKTTSIAGAEIKAIQQIYLNRTFAARPPTAGSTQEYDLINDYIDELASRFPLLVGAAINAIVDCGNGAAGTVMPRLVEKMQWQHTTLLYPEVDGTYPHHIADPTVEKNMADLRKALATSAATFGLGFDGDCDRMAPMTKDGRLVKGDQLLTLLSKPILEEHPGTTVVFDISSSTFLHELVRSWGGAAIIAKTGVASIKKAMEESSSLIGGEISCHTVFKDRYFGFDDGVYSMLRLFELLHNSRHSLEELLQQLPAPVSSPTYRLPCERITCLQIIDELKQQFVGKEGVEAITIDGLRLHFPDGWAIVRPSSTEPLISMRFEGRTEEDLVELIGLFYPTLSLYIDCSPIDQYAPSRGATATPMAESAAP